MEHKRKLARRITFTALRGTNGVADVPIVALERRFESRAKPYFAHNRCAIFDREIGLLRQDTGCEPDPGRLIFELLHERGEILAC